MKRTTQILVALVGMLLISFAVPMAAKAEQCSPDGKICLVTEATPSQPLAPSAKLRFRVTSEASQIIVPQAASGGLVEQGPPGGMSLWEVVLSPVSGDQVVHVEVDARGADDFWVVSSFDIPVLGAAANQTIQIRRTKKRVTAIYWFEARVPMEAEIRIALNSFKGRTQILKHLEKTWDVGPGSHELKLVLPRKFIDRKCGTKTAPHCSVLAVGELEIGGIDIYQGSSDRKKVTTKKHKKAPRL